MLHVLAASEQAECSEAEVARTASDAALPYRRPCAWQPAVGAVHAAAADAGTPDSAARASVPAQGLVDVARLSRALADERCLQFGAIVDAELVECEKAQYRILMTTRGSAAIVASMSERCVPVVRVCRRECCGGVPKSSRGRRRLLILAVAATLAGRGCVVGSAAAAPRFGLSDYRANLVRASVTRFVRADQDPLRVSVRTRSPVARLSVEVTGRSSRAIRTVRLRGLRWQVILPRRVLDRGLNQVTIIARVGRRWGAAVPSFRYLFPRRGLIRVLSPRPGATVRGGFHCRRSRWRAARPRNA